MTDMPMDIDDLKLAWQGLDRRLERQNALAFQLFKDGRVKKARSRLRPLYWGQMAQILVGVLVIAASVSVWTAHWQLLHLRLAGLVMHVYGVLLIIAGGRTLGFVSRLDSAAPVVAMQRQLALLRRWHVLCGMTIGLSWWLLWMPFMMVLAMWLAGVDIYVRAPAVFSLGTAIGVTGLLVTWGLHRLSRRPRWAWIGAKMDAAATGTSLGRAQAVIEEIRQFEDDDTVHALEAPTA
jgi:hypothetical protein